MMYQTLYCTYAALEMIDAFVDEYPTLYNLCLKYSDVIVDLPEDDFSMMVSQNPFLKALYKRENGRADTLPEFFEGILDCNLQNNSRDFFILDINNIESKFARDKFGIAIFSENELDKLDKLGISAKWNLSSPETYKCQSTDGTELNGWSAVLKGYKIVPVNTLVIIDNYLYHNDKECCHDNVLSLLNSLLPESLGVDLQLLLVLWDNGGGKFTRIALEKIKTDLESSLTSQYPYAIKIGIMTHNRSDIFHQRAIITNYHFLETQHGYHTFRNKNITRFINDLKANWAYSSVINVLGDSEIVWIDRNLREVKKQRATNNALPSARSYNYLIGDCFPNRLLD